MKTHKTAIAILPPPAIWEPIQAIRRRHDRHVERWMPHVNVLYPFRAPAELDAALPTLAGACATISAFRVTLGELRSFAHGRGRFTVWLAPEPAQALVD